MALKNNHHVECQLKRIERECGETSCSNLEEIRRNASTRIRLGKDKDRTVFLTQALDELQEILNDWKKKLSIEST